MKGIMIGFTLFAANFFSWMRGPWGALLGTAISSGAIAVLVVKIFSNGTRVRLRRDRAVAGLIEITLYREDPVLQWRAFRGVLGSAVRYTTALIPSALIGLLLVLVLLVAVRATERFGRRPVRPGELIHVGIRYRPQDVPAHPPELQLPPELPADVLWAHFSEDAESICRLQLPLTTQPGMYTLKWIFSDGTVLSKEIRISIGREPQAAVSSSRFADWPWYWIFHAEPRIPAHGPVSAIRIQYPARFFPLAGHDLHWLAVFVAVASCAGLVMASALKVEL